MVIEQTGAPNGSPTTKKVWLEVAPRWIGQVCGGLAVTGEARVVLGKIHVEVVIPDVADTASMPAGSMVTATFQTLFVPQGIAPVSSIVRPAG